MKRFKILLTAILLLLPLNPVSAQTTTAELSRSAKLYFDLGDYEHAEDVLKNALEVTVSGDSRSYSRCLQDLALIKYLNFEFVEAERLYAQALPLTESACGSGSLEAASNLYGLCRCLRRQSKFSEAEPLFQRILDVRIRQLGDNNQMVSNSHLDLAVNFERQGKLSDACLHYQRAISVRENIWGKDSEGLLKTLTDYSILLQKMNREREAAKLIERADSIKANGTPMSNNGSTDNDRIGWLTFGD